MFNFDLTDMTEKDGAVAPQVVSELLCCMNVLILLFVCFVEEVCSETRCHRAGHHIPQGEVHAMLLWQPMVLTKQFCAVHVVLRHHKLYHVSGEH